MLSTVHGIRRAQQRSIPPVVVEWLDEFGERIHDHHGAIKVFFSHRSVRRMQSSLSAQFVGQISKYLGVYSVVDASDGRAITIGWRSRSIRRKFGYVIIY
jgi:hypothetical protein